MKLWTTVNLNRLPHVLQNGLDNPYSEEIQFSRDAARLADDVLSMPGELAFLETEIPDDQLDDFFVECVASHSDELSDAEAELEYAQESGEAWRADHLRKMLQAAEGEATTMQMLDLFGYVCLGRVLPPSMLKLLDPATMLEAVHSGDVDAVAHAVENAEATAFKSLGANFWVWLMMLMSQIFGPGYGIPGGAEPGELSEEEAEDIERVRASVSKRPRKKRSTRKKKASS